MLSMYNQMPYIDQIAEIAPYVRTYFWATVCYKYHGCDHTSPYLSYDTNIPQISTNVQ